MRVYTVIESLTDNELAGCIGGSALEGECYKQYKIYSEQNPAESSYILPTSFQMSCYIEAAKRFKRKIENETRNNSLGA